MDTFEMDNDTRGWIMCAVSGVACVAGATVICVDSLVRLVPGYRNFKISDSSVFLAASLSLSFGVMIFSSLYSMLPTSRKYFLQAGFSAQGAGFWVIVSFVVGFLGIQVISRLFHQLMPSHVVDCDHTHAGHGHGSHSHSHFHFNLGRHHGHVAGDDAKSNEPGSRPLSANGTAHESTPLLRSSSHRGPGRPSVDRIPSYRSVGSNQRQSSSRQPNAVELPRRPTLLTMPKRVLSFVQDTKPNCDEAGPCYGYTDPCGQECFKHLNGRPILRTTTGTTIMSRALDEEDERAACITTIEARAHESLGVSEHSHSHHSHHSHEHDGHHHEDSDELSSTIDADVEAQQQHHHHVPTNAFMSIGLQTAIAIAIHKFPEGFITWASNHANPDLGFNVFMALFAHNIAEGFALAMPLYLALQSRMKAILWSFLLGGLSQPIGALIAVLWFRATHKTPLQPNNTIYAALFAGTAGIMVSVGMNLFVESLSMNHNRNLTIGFAVLGMVILGLSNALVAS